jgi:hypothetical protein
MVFNVNQKAVLQLLLITAFATAACRKDPGFLREQILKSNHLGLTSGEGPIKINQGITAYDVTANQDSLGASMTPPGQYYEWEVIPSNGCDSIIGDKNKSMASFVFYCPGSYFLTARIYDSLTQNLVSVTDTIEISVTSDTLHATQPLDPDDLLFEYIGIMKIYSTNRSSPEVWIYLTLTSTKLYEADEIDYVTTITPDGYNYTINGVRLASFPFKGWGYDTKVRAFGWLELRGLAFGVPVTLNITCLGATYSGILTLINENHFTFTSTNWKVPAAIDIWALGGYTAA